MLTAAALPWELWDGDLVSLSSLYLVPWLDSKSICLCFNHAPTDFDNQFRLAFVDVLYGP